jgi:hypothetical protein
MRNIIFTVLATLFAVAVGFVLIPVLFGYNIVYLEDKYTKKI